MPVTVSYPGIYIQEVPSNAHTVTAAPTSITVFIGYSHPFKTRTFRQAERLFNFADYERFFGGHFVSGQVSNFLPLSVEQFFNNGGSYAYVVGLEPGYTNSSGDPVMASDPAARPIATIGGIDFIAREPTDLVPMEVTVNNLKNSDTTADIIITYKRSVETFRNVNLTANSPDFIAARLGNSNLVTAAPTGGGSFPGTFTAGTQNLATGDTLTGAFDDADFTGVFADDSSLDKVDIFNLMVLPGIADNGIWSAAEAFCERKRAFLIMDPPQTHGADASDAAVTPIEQFVNAGLVPASTNAALYFPYLKGKDPITDVDIELPPSGFVAGIYSRTDLTRGVWKAPAGLQATVRGTPGVVERGRMTDMKQGVLNPLGVNCVRSFSGVGSVVFGARTVVTRNPAFESWRYVPVRRTALFIEQSLYASLTWAIFEPNDDPLHLALRTTVENFMLTLFSQGAFQGATPSEAFLVRCDRSTTTQTDIDSGIVNIVVGFRPLKPAEFVIVNIALLAGQVQT